MLAEMPERIDLLPVNNLIYLLNVINDFNG